MVLTHMETTYSSIAALIMIRDCYLCLVSLKSQVKETYVTCSGFSKRYSSQTWRRDQEKGQTQGLKMDAPTRCSTMRCL